MRSFVRAWRRLRPTIFGTVPCSGFASTSVTLSNDESLPVRGNCFSDDVDALSRRGRLVDHLRRQRLRAERDARRVEPPADDVRHLDLVRAAVRGLRRPVPAEVDEQ